MSEKEIKCSKCGFECEKTEKYCGNCGNTLIEENNAINNSNIIAVQGSITLTKDYVTQYFSKVGFEEFTCIFLKDISSIKRGYKSNPSLLIVGILTCLFAFWAGQHFGSITLFGALIIGIILIGLFFATRKHKLIISAHDGTKIWQLIDNCSTTKDFIDKIIKTKVEI